MSCLLKLVQEEPGPHISPRLPVQASPSLSLVLHFSVYATCKVANSNLSINLALSGFPTLVLVFPLFCSLFFKKKENGQIELCQYPASILTSRLVNKSYFSRTFFYFPELLISRFFSQTVSRRFKFQSLLSRTLLFLILD